MTDERTTCFCFSEMWKMTFECCVGHERWTSKVDFNLPEKNAPLTVVE